MDITHLELRNATIEAIYWWSNAEDYYHRYFKRLDEIYTNPKLLNFFTKKIFEVFLKDYSVRRNISKGFVNVDIFLSNLIVGDFFEKVKTGDIDVIDKVSCEFKILNSATTKETKSLLSKIAFLINPTVYSLYDNQSKKALWENIKSEKKIKQKELNKYTIYQKTIQELQTEFKKSSLFDISLQILNEYKQTEAFNFFANNQNAFELRVIDKILWIKGQKANSRQIDNDQYLELLNF